MFKHTLLAPALVYSSLSIAGGPLVLEGPGGSTPVTYQNPNITLNIENGNLGSLTNSEADALVSGALALWNNISTSDINLIIDQAQIDLDINISNFETYLPNASNTVFNASDNLNPVVYDSNGEIIDAFFGIGQSATTIGFAASILTIGASYFSEGYAVINGKNGLPATAFKLLIAHEIGHLIGLDHTQVNINNQETEFALPPLCGTDSLSAYPLMYPFVCRDEETLHLDDTSAVSALYPGANINNNFGILQGQFVDETGNAVLGANIWAENTVSGETVSIVSDYLKQGTGFYKLYLPAGSYTLHANSINTLFFGGSGIGPYSQDTSDASFTSPHPITEVTFQGGSSGNDQVITVAVGQSQTINFALDGTTAAISAGDNGGDSFSDLFGATSHTTLLMLLGLLAVFRSAQKKQAEN